MIGRSMIPLVVMVSVGGPRLRKNALSIAPLIVSRQCALGLRGGVPRSSFPWRPEGRRPPRGAPPRTPCSRRRRRRPPPKAPWRAPGRRGSAAGCGPAGPVPPQRRRGGWALPPPPGAAEVGAARALGEVVLQVGGGAPVWVIGVWAVGIPPRKVFWTVFGHGVRHLTVRGVATPRRIPSWP